MQFGQSDPMTDTTNDLLRDSMILEHTHSFIVEYNFKTKQCYVDPAQRKYVSGNWAKSPHDKNFYGVVLNDDIPAVEQFLDFSELKPMEMREVKARFYTAPHAYEWFRASLVCYGDEFGERERVLITFTNAQQEQETAQKLKFLLTRDSLTHLPNSDSFVEMTDAMLLLNPDTKYYMIRMDVDKFRIINQIYGTVEGNNILRYIGVKIQECMENTYSGTYCRISSDIFCICMPCQHSEIDVVIAYIESALKMYPMNFDIVMSFGIYLITEDDRIQHVAISTLIDRAMAAQRTVKNNYINHVAYYNETIRKKETAEQIIVSEMRHALNDGQFQVYLQPKCTMTNGHIIGSEALVRWVHPTQGVISPDSFVPIFEKNGFISAIDYFVLEETCKMIRHWLDDGIPAYPVSVNVSRTDMYNPNLMEQINSCVQKYDIPHDLIAFELTESAFVSDNEQLYLLARLLRRNHFEVLMDDFGSGYSSLNALKELPVDILKIDLKFLPTSQSDLKANVILCSVVDMACKLGLDVIVEGVETSEQADFLRSIGCKNAQGYYFYKPMPISEYENCLTTDNQTIN